MDKKLSNPLALAVLAQLKERPMHPYEIAFQMRTRGLEQSIKLNYGSLYSVIETLQRDEYIVVRETQRDGRRPERTVYAITDKGAAVFLDWLRTILAKPVNDFPQLAAGLSFVGHLSPDEMISLCVERIHALTNMMGELQYVLDAMEERGLNRLFSIEEEYQLAQRQNELDWMNRLVKDITEGDLTTMRDSVRVWTALLHGDISPRSDDLPSQGERDKTKEDKQQDQAWRNGRPSHHVSLEDSDVILVRQGAENDEHDD